MSCFRNKHFVIDDELVSPPDVLAVDSRVKRGPSKIPVRVVRSAYSKLSCNPPLANASDDEANGRAPVNSKAAKKAIKQREANVTSPNTPQVRRVWNSSTRVSENLEQALPRVAGQAACARPVSTTHAVPVGGHLSVPVIPPKPVGTGIGRRSSSGSLIPVRIPPSRFSSSTVNDAPLKETSECKHKTFLKPVKTFFKRISRTLSGKAKKEKKAVIDALSAPIEIVPEKVQPTAVEIRINEEVVARPGSEVISEVYDLPSVKQDQVSTRASAHRAAILGNMADNRRAESSGNRATRRMQFKINVAGPIDQIAPVSENPVCYTTTVPESPIVERDSIFSVSTSTSSSSDIKIPSNAELQAMADALSATNRPATRNNRTARRRTMYVAPDVARGATEETTSPSPSFSSTDDIPTDSQLQIMESLLCVDTTSIKPCPVRRRQFTRLAPAVEVTTAIDLTRVPAPVLQSRLKHTLEDACAQTLSVDVTAEESPTSASASGTESAIVITAPFTDAIEEKAKASTASLDINVPSDSQLKLMESLFCGSDKAISFSDSGIALVVPGLPETRDVGLFPASSSDFLVPTDSQMQLMEDMLCGKEMLAGSAPLTGQLKTAAMYEQDGEAVDDHASDVSIPLANGIKCAHFAPVESSGVVVPTEAVSTAMEDSFRSPNVGDEQGSPDLAIPFFPARSSDLGSETSSEIMVPTDAEIHAMELALMSWGDSGLSSTEDDSNSDTGSSTNSANSSPLLGSIERSMLSSAGQAATARRSANRIARRTESYEIQPKRSALRKEPDIIEVDRATGLPVKSDWREVHFPEKELVQVAIIPREPATVDMSYIVPDPDPVQMTADKVFLNTPCLMPRTDVPGMRLDRVFPILNITSPRPDNSPPAPYRSAPVDREGSLLPEPKAESPPEDAPRRSPWANHNRFFDYEARVKSDPYTLGEHKELVLWRNRHRFGRRTSVYLPGVPFIIRDSKNVLKRASRALQDHICKLGLNNPRELPLQMPVRTTMVHNAHFLCHTEAEDCPCGKSRTARRLDDWFKPTNVSAYAITEVSQDAEDGLRDPETDPSSSDSDSDCPNTNQTPRTLRRAYANRVADSLLACGAYRARQLAHPLVTEYSHLYDLHPRRIYIPSATTSKSGSVSVPRPGPVSVSRLDNVQLPLDLSRSDLVVPQLIVTSPSSLSPSVSAFSGNSVISGLHPSRPWISSERHDGRHVSCPVNSVASSSGVRTKTVPQKASSTGHLHAPSCVISADVHANHHDIASQNVSGESLHRIIELSSDVLQEPHPSAGSSVASNLPLNSATSSFARRPESTPELALNAASFSLRPADTLRMPSTKHRGSPTIPFIRAVTSRALFLPKPSLNDLSYQQA